MLFIEEKKYYFTLALQNLIATQSLQQVALDLSSALLNS